MAPIFYCVHEQADNNEKGSQLEVIFKAWKIVPNTAAK